MPGMALSRRSLFYEEDLGAVRDVDDAIGRLEHAITAAGAGYPTDTTVRLRAQAISFATLTAARTLGCVP